MTKNTSTPYKEGYLKMQKMLTQQHVRDTKCGDGFMGACYNQMSCFILSLIAYIYINAVVDF